MGLKRKNCFIHWNFYSKEKKLVKIGQKDALIPASRGTYFWPKTANRSSKFNGKANKIKCCYKCQQLPGSCWNDHRILEQLSDLWWAQKQLILRIWHDKIKPDCMFWDFGQFVILPILSWNIMCHYWQYLYSQKHLLGDDMQYWTGIKCSFTQPFVVHMLWEKDACTSLRFFTIAKNKSKLCMESPEQGNQRRDGKILTTWGVGKKILQAVREDEVKAS